jgi:nucleoside-diphosphate-sugar epimerase
MYKNRRVLVTGGLGFIGSNLAIRLVREGARVSVVDAAIPGCGADIFNVECVRDVIRIIPHDLVEADRFAKEIAGSEVIFNLAGEVSHSASMADPERDLRLNTLGQLRFLWTCRQVCREARIVYAGTRQVYGRPDYLPVDENHPLQPIDFNGVHKLAATQYHLLLTRRGELDAVILRLSNVYGPRMALHLRQQGFLATYVHNAVTGKPLEVFGDGSSLRDPVYIDDVVEAFLLAGAAKRCSRSFNVGGPQPLTISTIAEIISAASHGLPVVHQPFPGALQSIDIGSYSTNTSLITRELGWRPTVSFETGIRRTLDFYRTHFDRYVTDLSSFSTSRAAD